MWSSHSIRAGYIGGEAKQPVLAFHPSATSSDIITTNPSITPKEDSRPFPLQEKINDNIP